MNQAKQACSFAKHWHGSQKDDNGEDYFNEHVLNVVAILEQVGADDTLLAAGYLHDTIEDCDVEYCQLWSKFGHEIADLVLEVTHEGSKDKGYYFPRLHTQRGIMLKFADRLSNISHMQAWSRERRDHYLRKSKFWKTTALPKININENDMDTTILGG